MSYFKNFQKIVHNNLLTRANHLSLNYRVPAKLADNNLTSDIQHIYPLPSIVYLINQFQKNSHNNTYKSFVKSDLVFLNGVFDRHVKSAITFVQGGGNLTGQAIADLYQVSDNLNVPNEWFKTYVQPQIQNKLNYLSLSNLYHILSGLIKSNSTSLITAVVTQISNRDLVERQLVDYDVNQTSVYTYKINKCQYSNPLLRALNKNQFVITYGVKLGYATISDFIKGLLSKNDIGYRLQRGPEVSISELKFLLQKISNSNNVAKEILKRI